MRWADLPPLTFTTDEVAVSGLLEPAYDIAGDTFDYAINGRSLSFAILDAMGHGLEASRMASLAVASYRQNRRSQHGLVETLQAMDRAVAGEFGESRFVTGQLGEVDLDDGTVRLVNAGHPRPFRIDRYGRVTHVECAPSVPMGLGPAPVAQAEMALDPGDVLLLYSDGVTESRSPSGEFFGDQRLAELGGDLVRAAERPAEVLRRIVRSLLEFQGPELRDDATVVYVGWRPPPR
jgi:serine phosphatase RsbU (regulator of sigma subunit)